MKLFFNGENIQGYDRETYVYRCGATCSSSFKIRFGSLSPRMTSGQIVTEGLLVHEPSLNANDRDRRAATAFEEVDLDPAWRNRYPHEFSGGQRQRIAVARAVIMKPQAMVLDETHLRARSFGTEADHRAIATLTGRLRAIVYFLSATILAVVRAMADHILVMKAGRVVEQGPVDDIFNAPRQEYTQFTIGCCVELRRLAMSVHKLPETPAADHEVYQTRVDLAAAHRLAVLHELDEGIDNHFTVNVPGYDDRYLILPFGRHWSESSCWRTTGVLTAMARCWKAMLARWSCRRIVFTRRCTRAAAPAWCCIPIRPGR